MQCIADETFHMKVYFYIPSIASGGAERQCAIMAAGLKHKCGHDVSVLVNHIDNQNAENKDILNSASVPVVGLSPNMWKAFWMLRQILRQNRNSVLFTFLAGPNLIGALACRTTGLKRVYSCIRCGWLPFGKRCSEIFVNRFLATGTVFNSYKAYDKFTREGFDSRKSLVISNAIALWDECGDRPDREVVRIVTVGRFTPEKDYHTWLKVVKNVCLSGCEIQAHIVGWGRLEAEVRQWVRDMSLDDVVVMHPGDSDVKKLLSDSDIYLSTSISEGVSNAILEAMNSGLPVVTTDAGDAARMVEDGVSGYVVSIKDVSALTESVVRLVKNRDDRINFGKCARQILSDSYSVDKVVGEYQRLIEEGGSGRCA